MSKNVTLKDIARETGVHVSTVSRALDPTARRAISAEVVERVAEAAARMGYRPNRLAAGLRTRRTMTVGVLLPDITNTLFPPMVRGIESALEPLGYASILVNTDNDAERERRLLSALLDHGVDGIIDVAASRNDPDIRDLAESGVPVVTANRKMDRSRVPAVVSDDAGGIADMLALLHRAGHRRIAHIAGPASLSTGVERRHAFNETARRLELPLSEKQAVATARSYHESEGRRAAEILLDRGAGFTAFLCANDRLAIGAIEALRDRGLNCPRDVSVTGFNDIPLLDHITPGLTTVRILKHEIGRSAGEVLIRMMTEPDAHVPSTTVLPVELVERASVAAPRSGIQTATG